MPRTTVLPAERDAECASVEQTSPGVGIDTGDGVGV